MKKSLLTIITFALVLVNLVLTAVMALTIIPEVNNVNALIGRVGEAIDLDIQSGDEKSGDNVSLESTTPYSLSENMTVSLKPGEDGEAHFAQVGLTLYLNNSSDVFETYASGGDLSAYDSVIKSQVNNVVGTYTIDDLKRDTSKACDEIKESLNTMFGTNLISKVEFSTFLPQ